METPASSKLEAIQLILSGSAMARRGLGLPMIELPDDDAPETDDRCEMALDWGDGDGQHR